MGERAEQAEQGGKQALLVITADRLVADALERTLSRRARLLVFSPTEHPPPEALIDVPAMLLHVDAEDPARALEAARRLASLSARRNLLLLLSEDLPEGTAEQALAELEPAAMLPARAPEVLVRYTAQRVLSWAVTERGSARRQHRPAPSLLGVSAALRDVIDQVKRIAPTRMSVLILGETGTGKELVARAIHEYGPRASCPFVAVNCGAIPETLLEAELFGVRRGAYTGAESDRRGLFEEAEGGTLFLDEIGDTPIALQAKLLRLIETKEVRPIGGSESRCVDVRILSATHRDLEAAVTQGDFRQDLYFRINTATIHVPPLRRRPVDIPFLAQHFAEELGVEHARRIVLHEGFLDALCVRRFPGNVRELRNTVERAIALAAPGQVVTAEALEPQAEPRPAGAAGAGSLREQVQALEVQIIRAALGETGGHRTRTAERLGLSRQGLRKKMDRYGL